MSTLEQASGPAAGMHTGREGTAASGLNVDAACIPNISPREQRRRLVFGVAQFGISLAILTTLLARGLSRWWRLPLLLLFWGAAAGVLQWRDQT